MDWAFTVVGTWVIKRRAHNSDSEILVLLAPGAKKPAKDLNMVDHPRLPQTWINR